MPTQCKPLSFLFQGFQRRRITAAFDGGSITANAGALLLREIDRFVGLFDRVAACFTDHRDPRLRVHALRTLLAQRITGIALGYEDLNDHDDLRHDPLLALLADTLEGRRKGCAPLAGKSTLQRLEHAPAASKPGRYHRIGHDPDALQAVLVELFIELWEGKPPSRLVLDIDATDDEVHGRQEGRYFHGYYGHYCFLPLYITCGGRPLFALLRPGNSDPAAGAIEALDRIIARLRQEWPWLKILLRADSAYAREDLLAWCEDNRVDYVIGVAKNARLIGKIEAELAKAQAKSRPPRPPGTPVRRVPLRHADELVAPAPRRREGRTPAGQGEPPLRRHLAARRPVLGPHRLRARLLSAGRHGEHDQGTAARSLLRPDLGVALRRQPAPPPLLRLRVDPLRCPQARARRHPPGPRHRRNAPAQAPQDRRPRHRLGATSQGRHGLRASLRRCLRSGPRPIASVVSRPRLDFFSGHSVGPVRLTDIRGAFSHLNRRCTSLHPAHPRALRSPDHGALPQ